MMAVLELLVEEGDGSFGLSPSGQLLRSDHPGSLRDRILYIGAVNYPAARAMLHSVQTGEPAFDHVFGEPFFDHFARRPELGALFNRLMTQNAGGRIAGILGAWDFGGVENIADIGGGQGALLAAILEANPRATGCLFDTPEVVAEARTSLAGNDAAERIDLMPGDLFRGPFPGGRDIYIMSQIIHDWDDKRAAGILRNCRAAVRHDSRLLLIEEIMPSRVADSPSTIANDFSMLLLTGGRERTEAEYRRLLESAGFRLVGTTPFAVDGAGRNRRGSFAVLECTPV
jgi:SAM-dependent methyltransferase